MQVNSIQEMEDKTIQFSGTLSPTEGALVVAFGLNTMLAMGLMHLVPDIDKQEFSTEGPMQ